MKRVVVPPKTDCRPDNLALAPPVKVDAPVRLRTSTPEILENLLLSIEPAVEIVIVSLPVPPIMVAASPKSEAVVKTILSSPAPALIESAPPPPTIESVPLPATMES